jgi:hypothetical protein
MDITITNSGSIYGFEVLVISTSFIPTSMTAYNFKHSSSRETVSVISRPSKSLPYVPKTVVCLPSTIKNDKREFQTVFLSTSR